MTWKLKKTYFHENKASSVRKQNSVFISQPSVSSSDYISQTWSNAHLYKFHLKSFYAFYWQWNLEETRRSIDYCCNEDERLLSSKLIVKNSISGVLASMVHSSRLWPTFVFVDLWTARALSIVYQDNAGNPA